jgi:hypothetical protein
VVILQWTFQNYDCLQAVKLMDPTKSLFRTYTDNESVIAEVQDSFSIASSHNVADLRDFDDDGGSPNWSPRSGKCSTCDTRLSKSHMSRTVITIPRSSFKNNATITVKKSLDITPGDFEKPGPGDVEPADNGLLRREFKTQNARVRELTQQLRQTEQKLQRETDDMQRKFKQAVDALRAAAEHENNIMQRLARCEIELAEAEEAGNFFKEKHSTVETELHQSNAQLQQMCSAIDRLEKENRELVARENEIKTHSASALQELAVWKEKCTSLDLQLVEQRRSARNDIFHLRTTLEASAEESRSKLEQSRASNESSLKEAKAKNHEMRHRLAEVTKENIGLRESLARNEEQQKETLRRVKFEVESSAQRAENLQAALATHAAESDKEQLVARLELERLQLEVRRRRSEAVELEKKMRQAELINEQRLAVALRERDQIRSENSRLKLQETSKVEAAVRRERANKTLVSSPETLAAQQLLAKANAENEELRRRLAGVADEHRRQVDELHATNLGLVAKIVEFKKHFAKMEKSDSVVAVSSKRTEFHLQTCTHHDHHDPAFCAYKN